MAEPKKYLVYSTYRVTGQAVIVARSAAEAARIGRDGYASGAAPQFDFSDPHSETQMRAERMPDDWAASDVRDSHGIRSYRATDREVGSPDPKETP